MVHPMGSGACWSLWLVTTIFVFAPVSAGQVTPVKVFFDPKSVLDSPVDGLQWHSEQVCSIQRYGKLTMFNGETADVEIPCKYRLSDFTCGGFRVKVTAGSEADDGGRFSPEKVRVKVVNEGTSELLIVQTSKRRTDMVTDGKPINPWRVTNGSMSVVDLADFEQTQAAVVKKEGVFSVEFSSTERSVFIRCFDENFTSPGLPDTLCGDGTTADALAIARTALFPETPDVTTDALVNYVILDHEAVVQTTCKGIANKFQSCKKKPQAAMQCGAIFGNPSQVQCLAKSNRTLRDYHRDCLTSVCDNDVSAAEPMNNFILEYCPETTVTSTPGVTVTTAEVTEYTTTTEGAPVTTGEATTPEKCKEKIDAYVTARAENGQSFANGTLSSQMQSAELRVLIETRDNNQQAFITKVLVGFTNAAGFKIEEDNGTTLSPTQKLRYPKGYITIREPEKLRLPIRVVLYRKDYSIPFTSTMMDPIGCTEVPGRK